MSAEEAFIGQILLGHGKGAFFTAGGQFFYRHLRDITQPPFGLYEKITAESITVMLDDNILTALFIECANRMFAADAIGQYRVKDTNA